MLNNNSQVVQLLAAPVVLHCPALDSPLSFTPCAELAVLPGIVPAGVLGPSVLEGIGHSQALFISENGHGVGIYSSNIRH